MTDLTAVRGAVDDLEHALALFESACLGAGAYMPALATRLRIYADELADRYPDDTNGGEARAVRTALTPIDG